MIGYTETLKGISEGEQTDKKLSNKIFGTIRIL